MWKHFDCSPFFINQCYVIRHMTDKIDGKLFEKNEIAGGNIFC